MDASSSTPTDTSSESVTSIFSESPMSTITSILSRSGDDSDKDGGSVTKSITDTGALSSGTAIESPISTSREVETRKNREMTTFITSSVVFIPVFFVLKLTAKN